VIDYLLPLPENAKREVANAESKGWSVYSYKSVTPHPHPLSAGFRSVATAHALGLLHAAGARSVVSLYGSDRDLRIVARLNRGVAPGEQMQVHVTGADIVPQDLLRRRNAVTGPLNADGFLLVDVYQLAGAGGDQPISVEFLASLCTKGPIVWIGHQFNGAMGLHVEGCWVRRSDAKILSFPDPRTASYACHFDPEWLHLGGSRGGVSWTVAETLEDLNIVFIDEAELVDQPRTQHPSKFSWQKLPVPVLDSFASQWLFSAMPSFLRTRSHCWSLLFNQTEGIVDVEAARALRDWWAYRMVSQYSVAQLTGKARDLMRDKGYKQVAHQFPEETAQVLENTVLSALTSSDPARARRLTALNLAHGHTWTEHNLALRSVGTITEEDSYKWATLGAGAIFTLVLFLWYFFPGPSSAFIVWLFHFLIGNNMTFSVNPLVSSIALAIEFILTLAAAVTVTAATALSDAVLFIGHYCVAQLDPVIGKIVQTLVLAPILEELIKHAPLIGFPVTLWIGIAEMWGQPPISLATHLFKHWIMHRMSLKYAIFAHFFHNLLWVLGHFALYNGLPLLPSNATLPPAPMALGWSLLIFIAVLITIVWCKLGRRALLLRPEWEQFRAAFYDAPWEARPPTDPFPDVASEPLVIERGVVRKEYRSYTEYPDLAKAKEVELVLPENFSFEEFGEPKITNASVFFMMPVNAPAYSPGQSDENLATVLLCRLAKKPPTEQRVTTPYWAAALELALPGIQATIGSDALDRFLNDKVPSFSTLARLRALAQEGGFAWCNRRHAHLLLSPIDRIDPVELDAHWAQHFDTSFQRKRADKALRRKEECRLDGPSPDPTGAAPSKQIKHTAIELKKNEQLYQRRVIGDMVFAAMKPRPIANVSPDAQAEVGPSTNAAAMGLKQIFHPLSYHGTRLQFSNAIGEDYWIEFFYGGACNDLDLTMLMERFLTDTGERVAYVVVSGDDVAVFLRWNGRIWTAEADMSMFDQSHGCPALRVQLALGFCFGLNDEVSLMLDASHFSTYLVKCDQGTARVRRHRPSRDTGGADTSFGNSLTVGAATIYALKTCIEQATTGKEVLRADLLAQGYLELGFKAKILIHPPLAKSSHNALRAVTFLKGKWWLARQGSCVYLWAPLPSRCLKFGKSLRDPREVFRGSSLLEASKEFLAAQSCQYASFAQLPVLSSFVKTCAGDFRPSALFSHAYVHKVPGVRGVDAEVALARWLAFDHFGRHPPHANRALLLLDNFLRGHTWEPEVDHAHALLDMSLRYGIEPEIITATHDMVARSKPPSFLMSPLFEQMARVDYG